MQPDYGGMEGGKYAWMHGWKDAWMEGWLHGGKAGGTPLLDKVGKWRGAMTMYVLVCDVKTFHLLTPAIM